MAGHVRNGIIGVLDRLFPKLAESIAYDSRCWVATCTKCGETSSIWEMGGMRWKAKGHPRRVLRCPRCGKSFMGRLEKLDEPLEPLA